MMIRLSEFLLGRGPLFNTRGKVFFLSNARAHSDEPMARDCVLLAVPVLLNNMGLSENWGTLFWGPYNKDATI